MESIVEGERSRIERPFPVAAITELHGWLKACPGISGSPQFPEDVEELKRTLPGTLQASHSWAVYDRTDGALSGFVLLAPYGLMAAQAFVASSRKIWGSGILDEAAAAARDILFLENNTISYIFAMVPERNAPSRAFSERLGMRPKNIIPDYFSSDYRKRALYIYELRREDCGKLPRSPRRGVGTDQTGV